MTDFTVQFVALNLPYTPDDGQILKRLLLKRCIYGVDLNPFAVELARLSLWMDSFIFGTPLSFIEHHIQHGNALVGATVQDCIAYNTTEGAQDDLFVQGIAARFDALRDVMHQLDAMRDTTAQEVAHSKTLWRDSITPQLRPLLIGQCRAVAQSVQGHAGIRRRAVYKRLVHSGAGCVHVRSSPGRPRAA